MKKISTLIIISIILLLLLASFLFLARTRNQQYPQSGNGVREIQLNGKNFSAEMAATPDKRALGLSGRSDLCADCAMLFVFEKPGNYAFWMKGMNFDLDMIWIAGNEIVDISRNIPYEKGSAEIVRPQAPADKVLEVKAGTSDELNLKVEDKVDF